jgi:hypothetical protein
LPAFFAFARKGCAPENAQGLVFGLALQEQLFEIIRSKGLNRADKIIVRHNENLG